MTAYKLWKYRSGYGYLRCVSVCLYVWTETHTKTIDISIQIITDDSYCITECTWICCWSYLEGQDHLRSLKLFPSVFPWNFCAHLFDDFKSKATKSGLSIEDESNFNYQRLISVFKVESQGYVLRMIGSTLFSGKRSRSPKVIDLNLNHRIISKFYTNISYYQARYRDILAVLKVRFMQF